MDLLEARGDLETGSAEAEAFAQATLKDVVTHEVGHTLGLQHNFRASTIYTLAKISDRDFTAKHGIAGSAMDYNAFNVATSGDRQGEYVMSTIGPYDYWAIEYAYRPIPAEQEKEELAQIAARSNEPRAGVRQRRRRRFRRLGRRDGPGSQSARPGRGSARVRAASAEALARAVGPAAVADAQARRELRPAASRPGRRPEPGRAGHRDLGQEHRRRRLCPRSRGQRARSVHAGAGGEAARGAQAAVRRALQRQQLQDAPGVPASPDGRPVRPLSGRFVAGDRSRPTFRCPTACCRSSARRSTRCCRIRLRDASSNRRCASPA